MRNSIEERGNPLRSLLRSGRRVRSKPFMSKAKDIELNKAFIYEMKG